MTKMEMQEEVVELVDTMIAELKAADNYLDMAECWDMMEDKKRFVEFACTEIYHYKGVKEILQKEKDQKYKEFISNNPIIDTFMESLCHWKDKLESEVAYKKKEYNMN